MVRLQDLLFCKSELVKISELLIEGFDKEEGRLKGEIEKYSKFGSLELPVKDGRKKVELVSLVQKQLLSHEPLNEGIARLSGLLVYQLVYVELKEELFERLYMPTCGERSLRRLLKKFQNDGWPSFLRLIPDAHLVAFKFGRKFIEALVHAWVYVVADMAFRGRPFTSADISVLLEDAESLHGLTTLFEGSSLGTDPAVAEALRLAGCLPLLVSGGAFDKTAEEGLKEPNDVPSRVKRRTK
jgi:hypothetical protein